MNKTTNEKIAVRYKRSFPVVKYLLPNTVMRPAQRVIKMMSIV